MKQGWEIRKLGDVCDFQNGFAFKSNTYKETGLPILRITNIQNQSLEINELVYFDAKDYKENFDRFKVVKDDIVVAMSGATTGKLGINTTDTVFYLNQRVGKFIPKKEILKPFLYYFLSTKVEESLRIAAGAAQPNLSTEQINNFQIPLPPLAEQQRIVAILDAAGAAISKAKANAEQNLKNAKELFESYLQGVFENKGQGWVKDTLQTLLEKGWIVSHLDGNHGGDYPKREEFKNEGVPYISANCLRGTNIDFSLAKHLSPEKAATFRKGVAINNDVLFAHNATVGPVAILKTEEEKVILGTSLSYYRCNTEYILPEYLANYMRSKEFKQQYEIIMRQSTRNQVPITKQREFYHIIPPIDYQKQIVINLEQLLVQSQKLEAIYQQKINDLEELKKSVLQKAFSGDLKTATAV